MNLKSISCGLVLGVAATLAAGTALTQEPPPEAMPGMTPEAMAMVKAMKEAHANPTVPSEFHAKLASFVGEWDVTIRIWAMGPDAPPMESHGTAHTESIFGDRFTMETLSAELDMGGMKMPLDSISIIGYDNFRNLYVGSLVSAMSTEIINFQGGVSPDGSTFNFYGKMHEPMLNVTGRLVRFATTLVDEDNYVTDVYDLHAGEDYRVLQFSYERK